MAPPGTLLAEDRATTDASDVTLQRSPTVSPTAAEQPGQPGEPRWLDEDEQLVWRTFLSTMQLLMDRFDRQLQHDSGIVLTYYEMLVRLSEAPGRSLRMSELAESSLSSRSRVSHAVARMEERGWVRREACPTDGRGFVAVLTDEGFAALTAAAPAHVETVRGTLFDQLAPAQIAALHDVSTTLLQHLTATGAVPPVPGVQLP
jgi:DNA-binding MarR family transcriptional regulator